MNENLHKGSKGDYGEDLDIDEMIEKMGCSQQYYDVEECLGDNDRDWTKCQQQVHLLMLCNKKLARARAAKYNSHAPPPKSEPTPPPGGEDAVPPPTKEPKAKTTKG